MNKIKKSIIFLIIFTLIIGFCNISKAENIADDIMLDRQNLTEDSVEDINDSLEDILSNHGLPTEEVDKTDSVTRTDGNFFKASDESFTLNTDVNGDIFIVCSGKFTLDSYVTGSAFICADEVEITSNADISSSMFCVSNNITIYGGINLNAYCVSEKFSLEEDSHIYKNLYLTSENISLNGLIENHAFVSGNDIKIQENCNIQGDLNYSSPKEIEIPEFSVKGNTRYSSNAINITPRTTANKILDFITSTISYIIFVILVFLVLNKLNSNLPDNINDFKSNLGKYTLFGLLVLFVLPILDLVLLFIPFLTRFAFAVLLLYILLLILASAITVITLSKICANKYKESIKTKDSIRTILFIVILSVIYKLFKLIPILGFLVTLAVVILGIGISVKILFNKKELNQ